MLGCLGGAGNQGAVGERLQTALSNANDLDRVKTPPARMRHSRTLDPPIENHVVDCGHLLVRGILADIHGKLHGGQFSKDADSHLVRLFRLHLQETWDNGCLLGLSFTMSAQPYGFAVAPTD